MPERPDHMHGIHDYCIVCDRDIRNILKYPFKTISHEELQYAICNLKGEYDLSIVYFDHESEQKWFVLDMTPFYNIVIRNLKGEQSCVWWDKIDWNGFSILYKGQ